MEQPLYVVTATPHIRTSNSIERTMLFVILALTPATLLGVVFFGLRALLLLTVSVVSAVVFEGLYQKLTRKPLTITDGSAVVTGLLLALTLPPGLPVWMPVMGTFVAIIIVKQLFGGLGQNFLNPALAGRAALTAAFAGHMTIGFTEPLRNWLNMDVIASPTPLNLLAYQDFLPGAPDFLAALIGNVGGSIGETSAAALLVGGLFLLFSKVITWHIPVSFISAVFILTAILNPGGLANGVVPYHLLIGGLMLGAFFMATDYPTSPVTAVGKIIFGIGCGVLTVVIRFFGGYPEGVAYSILLMNLAVPLIDRYTRPRVYGAVKGGAKPL